MTTSTPAQPASLREFVLQVAEEAKLNPAYSRVFLPTLHQRPQGR